MLLAGIADCSTLKLLSGVLAERQEWNCGRFGIR
jgi:hypothetical protein